MENSGIIDINNNLNIENNNLRKDINTKIDNIIKLETDLNIFIQEYKELLYNYNSINNNII